VNSAERSAARKEKSRIIFPLSLLLVLLVVIGVIGLMLTVWFWPSEIAVSVEQDYVISVWPIDFADVSYTIFELLADPTLNGHDVTISIADLELIIEMPSGTVFSNYLNEIRISSSSPDNVSSDYFFVDRYQGQGNLTRGDGWGINDTIDSEPSNGAIITLVLHTYYPIEIWKATI